MKLPHDRGNSSHSFRMLAKRGWVDMGRSPGGNAANVLMTPAGQNAALKLDKLVNKE
jgi:hypothetical protein